MQLMGMLHRRSRPLLVAIAATMGLSMVIAIAPAMAANAAGTIQVSEDGIVFGPSYSGVLFDGVAKIVPGDTQAEVFYLRNTGPDDGYLRLTLDNVSGDPALVGGLSVSASTPAHSGSHAGLAQASPCWVLNEGILLRAGETVTVTAQLSFDTASGNPTKNSSADFDVVASLTDTAVSLPPTECDGSGTTIPGTTPPAGELPYTGGEVPVMLVIVTAFVLGAGIFLVVAARRRKRE